MRRETMEATREIARKALRTSSVDIKRGRAPFAGPLNLDERRAIWRFYQRVSILGDCKCGYLDGKTRFRKLKNSLILRRKIVYASIFLAVAIVMPVIVWSFGLNTVLLNAAVIILAAIALGMVAILSLLGTSIIEASFPGN